MRLQDCTLSHEIEVLDRGFGRQVQDLLWTDLPGWRAETAGNPLLGCLLDDTLYELYERVEQILKERGEAECTEKHTTP